MTRIQMDFNVTVIVDVVDNRCDDQLSITDPVGYAKQFVTLSPAVHGNHNAILNGRIIKRLDVIDTDIKIDDVYCI